MVLVISLWVTKVSRLGFRFFIIILLVSLCGLIFTSIYINYSIDRRFFDYLHLERKEEVETLISVIEESLEENSNWIGVRALVNDFVRVNGIFIMLEDIRGNSIYNMYYRQNGMKDGMMKGMMHRGHNNILPDTDRGIENFKENSERFAIEYQGETAGYLYWYIGNGAYISERAAFFSKRVNRIILLAGLLVAVITILISLYLSRYLSRPLIQMNKIADKVTRGEFDHHVEVRGNDELAELGYSFNEMVDKLRYLEKIRKESTSDLAHELRTPLTTINSYLEGIREGIITANDGVIKEIEEELQRLISLVNRLGELTNAEKRIVNGEVELLSFSDMLKNIVDRHKPLADKTGIRVEQNIQPDINLKADPKNLETIIINLITNAIKYTPKKGKVNIVLKREEQNVILEVSDTGVGISSDDLPYIFERFYRVDKSRSIKTGGTGIGLTITREIVKSMGGSIEVFSKGIGYGTAFIIKFPINKN